MGGKTRRQRERATARELERRLTTAGVPVVLDGEPGLPRISDALIQVAHPFVAALAEERDLTQAILHDLFTLVVLVWNATALPDGDALLDEARRICDEGGRHPAETRRMLGALIERRRARFPNDKRLVASFTVNLNDTSDEFTVCAAYAGPTPANDKAVPRILALLRKTREKEARDP